MGKECQKKEELEGQKIQSTVGLLSLLQLVAVTGEVTTLKIVSWSVGVIFFLRSLTVCGLLGNWCEDEVVCLDWLFLEVNNPFRMRLLLLIQS